MGAILPLLCTALAAISLFAPPLLASAGPDISGNWLRSDGTVRVHIAACGSETCATNTWTRDDSSGEKVGDRLVMRLEPQGDSKLLGSAFDVRRQRSYSIDITVQRNSMLTHGCMIKGIVCKTMSWSRTP